MSRLGRKKKFVVVVKVGQNILLYQNVANIYSVFSVASARMRLWERKLYCDSIYGQYVSN